MQTFAHIDQEIWSIYMQGVLSETCQANKLNPLETSLKSYVCLFSMIFTYHEGEKE